MFQFPGFAPCIARWRNRFHGQFGLDTSTKANLMSGVYAAQTAINISKTVVKAVAA